MRAMQQGDMGVLGAPDAAQRGPAFQTRDSVCVDCSECIRRWIQPPGAKPCLNLVRPECASHGSAGQRVVAAWVVYALRVEGGTRRRGFADKVVRVEASVRRLSARLEEKRRRTARCMGGSRWTGGERLEEASGDSGNDGGDGGRERRGAARTARARTPAAAPAGACGDRARMTVATWCRWCRPGAGGASRA